MNSSNKLKTTLPFICIALVAAVAVYLFYGIPKSPQDVSTSTSTPQQEIEFESIATTSVETENAVTSEISPIVNEGCIDGWCQYTIDEKYGVEVPEGFQPSRLREDNFAFEKTFEAANDREEPYGLISVSLTSDPKPFEEWKAKVLVDPIEINGDTWYGGSATIEPCGTYIYYRGSYFVRRVLFRNCMPNDIYYDESISPKFLHEHTNLVERVLSSLREI
ncbi:hypothetical protein GVX82_02365 [Patescibacteria group bacterium]|nr:hypothetical protein [Patescibacteria group bacterium]